MIMAYIIIQWGFDVSIDECFVEVILLLPGNDYVFYLYIIHMLPIRK